MGDVDGVLKQVATRVGRYRTQKGSLGEENTKAALIEPVLRALEWDTENVDEVRREYRPRRADKPVDYAVFAPSDRLRLFIEAKPLGENLDDRRWANQIMGYATVAGAKWVVLTDGDEYRIYNAHAGVPIEDKLFRRIRISDESKQPDQGLHLLSKSSILTDRADALWKAESADRLIKEAITGLFLPTPSPSLIRLLRRRVEGHLSAPAIGASLKRVNVQVDFRTEPIISRGDGESRTRTARDSKGGRRRGQAFSGVSLRDLIEAALIKPPIELEKTYKGRHLTARVESDGSVTCLGQTYDSLSMAAAMARFSIIGAPRSRKYPQTNGWTFWHVRNEQGEIVPVDVFRQRYLKGRAPRS
jgi:hypothetical protein